jgi:hypothetical protein
MSVIYKLTMVLRKATFLDHRVFCYLITASPPAARPKASRLPIYRGLPGLQNRVGSTVTDFHYHVVVCCSEATRGEQGLM